MNIDTLVTILEAVPTKRLALLELADAITNPDGTIGNDQLILLEDEFNNSIPEAIEYSNSTHRLIKALQCKMEILPPSD